MVSKLLPAILIVLISSSSFAAGASTGLESSPLFKKLEKDPITDFGFEDSDIADIMSSMAILFGRRAVIAPDAHVRVTIQKSSTPIPVGQAWESVVEAARNQGLQVLADSKYVYIFRKGSKRPKPQHPGRLPSLPKSGTTLVLPKEKIRSSLENLESQAQIVPYFDQGKPTGSAVIQIQPGSVLQLMKIENGDIICGINEADPVAPTLLLTMKTALEAVAEGGSMRLCLKRANRRSTFVVQGH